MEIGNLNHNRLIQFKTALENSSDAISISEITGLRWYQNKAFDDLFGSIAPERSATLFVDPPLGQEILKTAQAGQKWVGEARMYNRNNEVIEVFARVYGIKNEHGMVIGLVGAYNDITRQKENDRVLQDSERKYRALVENTPDLLYRTDMEGRITFLSPSVYTLSGYTLDEAIGMKMAEEVYAIPGEREKFLKELREKGMVKNFQTQLRRKDGSIWWASTNAHFQKDKKENIIGVEGVTRDITEIRQAEIDLKKNEQQLRAILEANPDPMVVYNRIGHPQYLSPSFSKVFGWTIDQLKNRTIPFVPEDQKELTARMIEKIYTTYQPLQFETRRITKSGQTLDILMSVAITRGLDEEPSGIVVNLTNITERKLLEAQYEQTQKMESLGTLAGGIAHDFNNLLGGLFGYLDLARTKATDPKVREYLDKAFKSSSRAQALTHQLLTFSKGGAPVKAVECLNPFLQETAQFALSGANTSCIYEIPDDLWMCEFDINQIGQVIDNIIINAQHAMSQGGTIYLKAKNVTIGEDDYSGLNPGNYVRISISDTGIGIPQKFISKIFDPFFTTKQKGSGLGLTTSYSIIKRHGGTITVDSKLEVGSTFHVFLPAAVKKCQQETQYLDRIFKGSGTILVMDDDEILQMMLGEMLEDMGFTPVITRDGLEALQAFNRLKEENEPLRAVILDLTIRGGVGGKETVNEIRLLDSDLPVFVSSGYSEDDAIANPQKFGFSGSLKKPFGIQQISAMFSKHLLKEN